jgi:MbtH protein
MSSNDQEDSRIYLVVVNAEEQYSIWPMDKKVPAGWSAVGKQGPKPDCLQYIEEVWTDMRPLSLRQRMEAAPAPPD